MKTTNKNRKYKKITNKRRKSVKKTKRTKKTKGGDSINIIAYESLHNPKTYLYKVITERDFPKTVLDTMVYKPVRDVEESLAELNHSTRLSKDDFVKYPNQTNETKININYPLDRKTYSTSNI
jgi:hypothetical protein